MENLQKLQSDILFKGHNITEIKSLAKLENKSHFSWNAAF